MPSNGPAGTTATSTRLTSASTRHTTPTVTPAFRPDRLRHPGVPLSKPRPNRPVSRTSTSSAATMARTRSRRRSTSTIATSGNFRSSIFARSASRVARRRKEGWVARRRLPLAPLQLLAQHVEVGPFRGPDQAQRALGTADFDDVVRLQRVTGLTVERDVDVLAAAVEDRLDPHVGGARPADRTGGQHLRRDRREQQRVAGRRDDRSAGGEVVG